MIRLFLEPEVGLNWTLLKEHFELVKNPDDADILVYQSTDRKPTFDFKRKIYLAVEPPGANDHRNWAYDNFDKYFLVACFNPDPNKSNQIKLTTDPQFYPLAWWGKEYPCNERSDTTMNKSFFWAGHLFQDRFLEAHGAINISAIRLPICENLIQNYPTSQFYIPNLEDCPWNRGETPGYHVKIELNKPGNPWEVRKNWRLDKIEELKNCPCSFALALEHVIYPNFISEKLFDPILADKVPLYLGEPNIEKFVPSNCFIDLRKWFNVEKREFDYPLFKKYIDEFTQEDYDKMIKNIREFRKTIFGKQSRLCIELTWRIINYIKDNYDKR